MLRVTETVKKVLEALGCRPLVCHACAQPVNLGDVVGPNEGLFVHYPDCKEKPITLPVDEAIKAKLKAELEEVGGLGELLKGESDWQSQTVTKGPAFTFDEIVALLDLTADEIARNT
jgi:hypothetical protein